MYNGSGQPTLGSLLRSARATAGLSIRQLEHLTGVGRMTISRMENDALVAAPTAHDLSVSLAHWSLTKPVCSHLQEYPCRASSQASTQCSGQSTTCQQKPSHELGKTSST